MEVYGKILLIAMPAFLVLVLFEKWYGWFRGRDTYGHLPCLQHGLKRNGLGDVQVGRVGPRGQLDHVDHVHYFHLRWLLA